MSTAKPIGDITAKCPRCGEQRFTSTTGTDPKPEDLLTCSGCGHVLRHKDLVAQITKEGANRVEKALGDLVKHIGKRR